MKKIPLVSIIINNYNYGRFLAQAIDSALNQTYKNIEVIVVDDGSTDGSREIITQYDTHIQAFFKTNGGQTSALNLSFSKSSGEIIFFLDADDLLIFSAVERAVQIFQNYTETVKVHWPLWLIDESNKKTGAIIPRETLSEGDLLDMIVKNGPDGHCYPPTTGNAWDRKFLNKVLPLPEVERQYNVGSASADSCMSMLAPLFGNIRSITEPQGCYRIHGQNDYSSISFEKKLKRNLSIYNHRCMLLEKYCHRMGIFTNQNIWKENSWEHKIHLAIEELLSIISPENTFIFLDDEQWGVDAMIFGRRRIPFIEKNGQYWGPPPDDDTAIFEFERLRQGGADFIVFAWPAFWWLEHYKGFYEHLKKEFKIILRNDRLIIFDLLQQES